ncbi:hypothetical protein ACYTTR_08305, partial [Cobetia marina]
MHDKTESRQESRHHEMPACLKRESTGSTACPETCDAIECRSQQGSAYCRNPYAIASQDRLKHQKILNAADEHRRSGYPDAAPANAPD